MKHAAYRRIIELDRRIQAGTLSSIREFAREWEVSQRTVERDMQELRDDLGAPVYYNRRYRRYEYRGQARTLPAQWLTAREIAVMLIAERALKAFTGTSLDEQVHPAFNRFLDPIRHDRKLMHYVRSLCRAVVFFPQTQTEYDVRKQFATLINAILDHKRVSVAYKPENAPTYRARIDPYSLISGDRQWFLLGWGRDSRRLETLELHRLSGIRILDQYFHMPDYKQLTQYLPG
ncbi:MAG: WYL domain-containing protein [Chitinivibrionales bacterium]|nr:WYL domain-containing protein [Chitinivibrionales bacterium]MBD3395081.1 WYL domain-containing protein [Chitinivibrionales bacterium]